MTFEEFNTSLSQPAPPASLHPILEGLWYDGVNNWEEAHNVAQRHEGTLAYDRLHAYLHRKEGDRFNAGYWYRRAKAPYYEGTLGDEWKMLVEQYL